MKTPLEKALPIVAATYGQKFGVKVVVSGSSAATNGNTIVIPSINLSKKPVEFTNALWGFLTHEAAHVRLTDFNIFEAIPMRQRLLNVLEDGRIENSFIKMFPGTRTSFDATCRYVFNDREYNDVDVVSEADLEGKEADILHDFLLGWVRYLFLQQDGAESLYKYSSSLFVKCYGKGAMIKSIALLPKLANCESTADCLSLLNDLVKAIDEAEDDQEIPNDSDSDDVEQNDSSEVGDSDRSDNGADDSKSDHSSGDGSDDHDMNPSQIDASGSKPSETNGLTRPSKALSKAMAVTGDGLPDDYLSEFKDEVDDAPTEDYGMKSIDVSPERALNVGVSDVLQGKAKMASNRIRKQLLSLLEAKQRKSIRSKRVGKKLNHGKLHRLETGDAKVFLRETDRPKLNTAVHLMVDLSGSMNGGDDVVARESALALAYAMQTLPGVSMGVSYFGPGIVRKVLPQGSSLNQHVGRFGQAAGGYTPAAEAVWSASYDLMGERADRKVGILITDGAPSNPEALTTVLELANRSGIEFVGIGIGSDSVGQFIKNSITISSIDQLTGTLFGKIKNKLLAA